ncbi:MAG: hypothetical protein AAF959_09190 [Cyanobacteria bacterium P01_D01_bin.56]
MENRNRNDQYRLIWFQHFHKAAGTSIVNLAKLNQEVLYPNHDNGNPLDENGQIIPLWDYSDSELTQFIDRCEDMGVTFVANEWEAVNFELLANDPRVFIITCFRDPLKRLLSNFYFDYWSGYTNCDSIEQYLNSDGCFTMFNYYCRILSRHNGSVKSVDVAQFEAAQVELAHFDHLVLLESDRNFSDLRKALNWPVNVQSRHQNKSSQFNRRVIKLILSGRIDLLWRRFSHPREQPSQAFLNLFAQGNHWDQKLYAALKSGALQKRPAKSH